MDYVVVLVVAVVASLLSLYVLYTQKCRKREVKNDKCVETASNEEDCSSFNDNGRSDVVIVGAGVAGSSLAYALGKDGRRVHVIERDITMPNRMNGELLQPGGYLKLLELGLEDCVCEIDAQQVHGYVIYHNGKYIRMPYPLTNIESYKGGRSFHNGRFVQKLRQKAASLPNVKLEEGTVTALVTENETVKGVRYKTKAGEDLIANAALTVVCDGRFSNMRRSLCSHKVKVTTDIVGFVVENCELPYANQGHIIVAEPSSLMFYPISSTETRCFVDMPSHKVDSFSNGDLCHYLKHVVAPQIPSELYSGFISAIEKGEIRKIPHLSMSAVALPTPGAFLLGDARNIRHPITAGGMTVALSDVVILRDLLRPLSHLNDPFALSKHLQCFSTLRRPMATTINGMATTIHRIVWAPADEVSNELKEACLSYMSYGGIFASIPMSLFSGLNPSPFRLLLLFIFSAFYTTVRLFLPFPSPKGLALAYKLLQKTRKIIVTIVKQKRLGQMSMSGNENQAIHSAAASF